MTIILANLKKSGNDGYKGRFQTLSGIDAEIEVKENERTNGNGPTHRVFLAGTGLEVGTVWEKNHKEHGPYLQATLDDPSFTFAVYGILRVDDKAGTAALTWSRPKRKDS